MATFRDLTFTPTEFAKTAKIDRSAVAQLELEGRLKLIKKQMGTVERKVVQLQEMQNYFKNMRMMVATATDSKIFVPALPRQKIQMFYNVKGGTGKSTLSAQYAMRAAMFGYKVLALDLDGQGHLSVNLDVMDAHERPTMYDVLINDLPIEKAIMNAGPGLDLIPSNLSLCNIEIPLSQRPQKEYLLSKAIQQITSQYDLIVADTNPGASILNTSMLIASELVNVICATNPLSFHGMSLVMSTIEELEKELKRDIPVRIVPNLFDSREVISQEVLAELRSRFQNHCTKTIVNRSVDLNEAIKRRTTVWAVNAKGPAAHDIHHLTEELLSL